MTAVMTQMASSQFDAPDADPRGRMVLAAAKLLRQRGVTATGIRDVVDLAGSPRGSVQHYFPGGKDQLITEALALVAAQIARPLNAAQTGPKSATVFEVFALIVESWRHFLRSSDYSSGCPIASVVVDSSAQSTPLARPPTRIPDLGASA